MGAVVHSGEIPGPIPGASVDVEIARLTRERGEQLLPIPVGDTAARLAIHLDWHFGVRAAEESASTEYEGDLRMVADCVGGLLVGRGMAAEDAAARALVIVMKAEETFETIEFLKDRGEL